MLSRPRQVLRLVVAIAKHWQEPSRGFAQNVLDSGNQVNILERYYGDIDAMRAWLCTLINISPSSDAMMTDAWGLSRDVIHRPIGSRPGARQDHPHASNGYEDVVRSLEEKGQVV